MSRVEHLELSFPENSVETGQSAGVSSGRKEKAWPAPSHLALLHCKISVCNNKYYKYLAKRKGRS